MVNMAGRRMTRAELKSAAQKAHPGATVSLHLSCADTDQEVLRVLQDVSLGPDYLNRYPDELSGGERAACARSRGALVAKPELLICDEVTSSLDVSVQAAIVEMLRRLQVEHDLSMIFITHNLALVRSIAQECIVLSEGRVVEAGTVTHILEQPTNPYTIRLIAGHADNAFGFRGRILRSIIRPAPECATWSSTVVDRGRTASQVAGTRCRSSMRTGGSPAGTTSGLVLAS